MSQRFLNELADEKMYLTDTAEHYVQLMRQIVYSGTDVGRVCGWVGRR